MKRRQYRALGVMFLVILFVCLVGSSAAVLAADEGLPEDVSAILGKTLEELYRAMGLPYQVGLKGKSLPISRPMHRDA